MQFYRTKNVKNLASNSGDIPLLIPKKSSNISGIGYRNKLLFIEFGKKTIYSYENVPICSIAPLLKIAIGKVEGSLGRYFHANIKNVCKFKKITDFTLFEGNYA